MRQTEFIMGMPINIEILGFNANRKQLEHIFNYFRSVDERFSTFKNSSEITKINLGLIKKDSYSPEMKEILALCYQTKIETNGYFDISHRGIIDPSGIVKGWSIQKASELLNKFGILNFYIEAGGDIQVSGKNQSGNVWKIGIRNPFNRVENIKILHIGNKGIATSGTYIRGQHIYNPKLPNKKRTDIVSLTVIGPNVYEADRFATAAFAMGFNGIRFIEQLNGFEAYLIDKKGLATYTSGFDQYVLKP